MVMMGDKVRCQVKMPGRAFGVLVLDFLYTLCPGASPKLLSNDLNVVKVAVCDIRVEHEVRLADFMKWLERNGGSPREVSDRRRMSDSWDGDHTFGLRCRGFRRVTLPR